MSRVRVPDGVPGSLVKRLRHQPLTLVTRVRVPHESPKILGGVLISEESLVDIWLCVDKNRLFILNFIQNVSFFLRGFLCGHCIGLWIILKMILGE